MTRIVFFFFLFFAGIACKNTPSHQGAPVPADQAPVPSGKSGKELSAMYCGSCHVYPEADLLDKKTWLKEVLPNMGCRLGIATEGYRPMSGLTFTDEFLIGEAGIYPQTPKIASEDWQKIIAYYENAAPEKLAEPNPEMLHVKIGLPFFQILKPDIAASLPITTLCQINDAGSEIYLGTMQGLLCVLNAQLVVTDTFHLRNAPVHVFQHADKRTLDVVCMGEMRPTEDGQGILEEIDRGNHHRMPLLGQLKRPVYFDEIDLNNDGIAELIVCEFGYQTGKLAWYEKRPNQWKEHVLSTTAGASKVFAHDFNQDGLPDLAVLMAQGDEHISLFYNQGKGVFTEKIVLRFPPVYGSCDLQLVDFNQDGAMDLLYTNGDNADFSPVLKPYHGIRLFLNDGQNNFSQTFFYPMHGAFQAAAADFDLDGDYDVIASAFFPDKNDTPASSVIYLEQTKPMIFQPYSFQEATQGKWLTLHTGDLDHDGDTDVVIGSFLGYERGGMEKIKRIDKKLPFLFLKNKKL